MNKQEEIMEKASEKSKVASGIKEGRLKVLKENYQHPSFSELDLKNNIDDDCSDMASCCCVVIRY
jgi:hypothetical protein